MQQYERSRFVMGNLWGTHEEPVEDNYRRIVKAPPGQAPPRGIKVRLGAHQGSPNRKNVSIHKGIHASWEGRCARGEPSSRRGGVPEEFPQHPFENVINPIGFGCLPSRPPLVGTLF